MDERRTVLGVGISKNWYKVLCILLFRCVEALTAHLSALHELQQTFLSIFIILVSIVKATHFILFCITANFFDQYYSK